MLITYPIIVYSSLAFGLANDVQRNADLDDELFQDVVFQAGDDKAEQCVQSKHARIANQILFILLRGEIKSVLPMALHTFCEK